MREYEVVDTNAENIAGCGFCGYKAGRSEGHRRKSDWLRQRYLEGLLDYYAELHRYLRTRFGCVLKNDRLVVFDMRSTA